MICMFYLTGEVIDDKITTQCNGEDRYMSNLIKQIIASILESLKDQGTNNSEVYWHGVSLSDLNSTAKEVRSRYFVKIDESDCLILHWTSNSGKTFYKTQCVIGIDGKLRRMPQGYYQNQWRDDADRFVEMVNKKFLFE